MALLDGTELKDRVKDEENKEISNQEEDEVDEKKGGEL